MAKADYRPLLRPGVHRYFLTDIDVDFVNVFTGSSRSHRAILYQALEQVVQDLLIAEFRCNIYLDGSFLTAKPFPDDIDIIISVDEDFYYSMSDRQLSLIDQINLGNYINKLDAFVYIDYAGGSENFKSVFDAKEMRREYGLEHGSQWTKGYVVLRLNETNVGLRICN